MKTLTSAERSGLRSSGYQEDEAAAGPPRVIRVDPVDGATGVFRDVPVIVRLSHPADRASVSSETFRVEDADGPVPGRQWMSPDGRVVMWASERLLTSGVPHRVTASGIRDHRGRELAPHRSAFVPCDLIWNDLFG